MTERAYDPELAPMVATLPSDTSFGDIAAARAGMAEMLAAMATNAPPAEGVAFADRSVPGPKDAPDVAVRIYTPEGSSEWSDGTRPGVIYIHGGGFCVGTVDAEHAGALATAKQCDAVVLSVEYRLAPEHPFPAGLEDCYSALVWLHGEAKALGVDPDHIGVMGQSAGGGLAAGLALLARDRGGPHLCFQGLGIPELDDRLETTSMREFTDTPMWNRPNAELSWRYYLGKDSGGDVSPYAAPARATNLRNLPPAYVSTMEFDPLRDEGILYALRLLEAGVSVELHQFPGTFHGSSVIADAEVSRRSGAEFTNSIRRGLRRGK